MYNTPYILLHTLPHTHYPYAHICGIDTMVVEAEAEADLATLPQPLSCIAPVTANRCLVRCASMIPDGRIISGGEDGVCIVWNKRLEHIDKVLIGHTSRYDMC